MQSSTILSLPLVEKYRPKKLSDFVGNIDAVKKLENWLVTWNKQKKKVAWLVGPAGVGKTSVVYYLTRKYGFEYVEVNASDKRNKQAIEKIVGRGSQEGTVLQGGRAKKLILVDEADGLFGNEDRGGAKALARVVRNPRLPIICTSNDPEAAALKAAKKYFLVIEFSRLKENEIINLLKRVIKNEGIQIDEEIILKIARNAAGDARSALNDLQAYIGIGGNLPPIDLSVRDKESTLLQGLQQIFSSRDWKSSREAVENLDADYRELLMYVYEHAYKQAKDAEELENFYKLIAEADRYLSYCYTSQNWRFLKYFFGIIASIGLVKHSPYKYSKYGFPSYWAQIGRLRAKTAKMKKLVEKCSPKLHCSEKEFQQEYFPYLQIIFSSNAELAAGIAVWLGLDENDISFIVEDQKMLNAIMRHYDAAYKLMSETWIKPVDEEDSSFLAKMLERIERRKVEDVKRTTKDKEKEKDDSSEKTKTKLSKKTKDEVSDEKKQVSAKSKKPSTKGKKKKISKQKSLDAFFS